MAPNKTPKRNYSPLFALERIKNIPVFTTTSSFVETYASTAYKDEIEVIEYALKQSEKDKKVLKIIKEHPEIVDYVRQYKSFNECIVERPAFLCGEYDNVAEEKFKLVKEYFK